MLCNMLGDDHHSVSRVFNIHAQYRVLLPDLSTVDDISELLISYIILLIFSCMVFLRILVTGCCVA